MGAIRNKYALAPSTVPYKQTTFVFTRQRLWSHRNSRFEIYRFKPAILIFTRATSQSPCLHETLTTAAIIKIDSPDKLLICNATSKIREAYFISFYMCNTPHNPCLPHEMNFSSSSQKQIN